MYVRMYVYVCTYVHCAYVRMYACTHVRMYVCMYVRMYVCTYVSRIYVYIPHRAASLAYGGRMGLYVCMHNVHVCIYMCMCIYVYMCMCIYHIGPRA